MSQWVEIRHLYLVEGVAKKRIARRLQLDIKTVRRALEQPRPPVRVSSPRVRSLDPWREQIAQWLAQNRRVTAKRIRRLLLPLAGPVAPRRPATSRRPPQLKQGGPFSRGQKVPFLLAIPARSRSPVMGPDVWLRGARRRPHGGHWMRVDEDHA